MVATSKIFASSALLPSCAGKPSRRCRASHTRTLRYVRSSLDAWSWIYSRPVVNFLPVFHNCGELAAAVKRLLASCPSSDPREVLAYQSIKKGLPDSCRCMEASLIEGLRDNVVRGSPPSLPRGYLRFVKKETSRLFQKGWDAPYEGFCRRNSPSLKATLESSRADGGSLGGLTKSRNMSYDEWLDVVLHGRASPWASRLYGCLQVVQSAGKPRPLTAFSVDGQFLRPLHKTIYSSLSKKTWLSRGDVTSSSLRSAGFREGQGLLVSGDYSSATDNLSIEVMEAALDAMLETSVFVPENVKCLARLACRPSLFPSKAVYDLWAYECQVNDQPDDPPVLELRKGQMMGSFLSFPFLCLQNYLAFRWSTLGCGRIPCLINGDDILFQSDERTAKRWLETVGGLGLEVERTKTSIELAYGSLNSTLVTWGSNGELQVCKTLRFGMLRPSEYPTNLGVQFAQFVNGSVCPEERWRAGRVFFEFHIGSLRSTSFDLPSLGFRGSLAHRLARVYGLLHDRVTGSPPPAPVYHTVSLSPDLVSEVPKSMIDPWLGDLNASEVASWKWSHGFSPRQKLREAVRYAFESTRWTDDSNIVGLLVNAMSIPDKSFCRWVRGRELRNSGCSRSVLLRSFLREDVVEKTTQVMDCIVDECFRRTDRFGEPLPTYQESCESCGGAW
jgi:hypothetical protein